MRPLAFVCVISAPALACYNGMLIAEMHERFVSTATQAAHALFKKDYDGALAKAQWVLDSRAGREAEGVRVFPTAGTLKQAQRTKAIALVRLARHAEAMVALKTALAEAPEDPVLLSRLGEVKVAKGEDRAAKELLEPLAQKDLLPDADAHLALARALHNLGDTAGASKELASALHQEPDHIGARALRGVLDAEAAAGATAKR